jgi:hypothetical protein
MHCARRKETHIEQTYRNYLNTQGVYCEMHFYLGVSANVKRKPVRYKEWQVGILLYVNIFYFITVVVLCALYICFHCILNNNNNNNNNNNTVISATVWRRIVGMMVKVHIFLSSTWDGDEWSASRSGYDACCERSLGTHWKGSQNISERDGKKDP